MERLHYSITPSLHYSGLLMGFYEEIVSEYDSMTRFQERMQRETDMLKNWIERYQFHSAVDVACGTGIHAILLAQLGIQTVGADISEAMLAKAKLHAGELDIQLPWIQTPMEHARQHIEGQYDAVFCLGNSLPHLLTQPELDAAINSFFQLLSPHGILVIQLLNYSRILAEKNRIVGIHRQETTEYIRFYDFPPELIRFNLLTVHWRNGKATHTLNSTSLYPYRKHELEQALHQHGFSHFEYYGDMNFRPFEEQSSQNLVIVGKKHSYFISGGMYV